ncbi:hypothetical protein B0H11DRAFT_786549 [Mycena galericulata]|nr:hypothetical protein B0H11DRAFT_786549 [Mycena galericulata]
MSLPLSTTSLRGHYNKYRLYISLLLREKQNNFHWAITLAPKNEQPNAKDSMRYDAANTITASWNGIHPVPWRYRYDAVDPLLDLKLVARVLVAKLPSDIPFQEWADRIDETFRAVPLIQDNPSWNCRSWVIHALSELRALGGEFYTVPNVLDGNTEEGIIVEFAQNGKAQLLARQIPFGDIRVIPSLDMRHQRRN